MTSPRLFVHRHYDTLKIVGIYVNVLLAGGLFLYAINLGATGERRTTEVTKQIVQATKDEQAKQTAILQKQLRDDARRSQAMCVLLFELVGQTALKNIDPTVRRDCLNRVGEQEEERNQPSRADSSPAPTQPQSETQRSTEPTTSAPPESPSEPQMPAQPATPTPQSPNLIQRIVEVPGDIVDGVRSLLP